MGQTSSVIVPKGRSLTPLSHPGKASIGTRFGVLPFRDVLFLILVIAVFASVGFLVFNAGRDTTFYWDEWDFIQGSRRGGLDVLLTPHNGHLSIVPILIYRALFASVGLRDYAAYRITLIAIHLACCLLFFLLARRAVGRTLALLMTFLLLLVGNAWQDLLTPFQMSFLISLATGLLAFLLIDRPSTLGKVVAAASLVVSIGSSGVGIPMVAAAAVLILARPDRWSTIWIVMPAASLYGLWYIADGVPQAKLSNVPHISTYLIRSAAGAMGGMLGVGTDWGLILVPIAVAFLSLRMCRMSISPSMAASLTVAGTFWLLIAMARASLGDADANRYIYPGALFILLIAKEAFARMPTPPLLLAALGTMTAAAVAANVLALNAGVAQLRDSAATVRAELAAVEIARHVVKSDFQPDSLLMPQVSAGSYLLAVTDLGSPAYSVATIVHSPETVRASTDHVLERAELLELRGVPSAPLGPVPSPDDLLPLERQGGSCLLVSVPSSGISFTSPAGGMTFQSQGDTAVHVQLRRFAGSYHAPAVPVDGDGPIFALKLGADDLAIPWHVKVLGSGPVRVCGLSG